MMDFRCERGAPTSERKAAVVDRRRVQALDALTALLQEFDNAVDANGEIAGLPNDPQYLLAWLDDHGPAPLQDLRLAMALRGADSTAVLDSLQARGLIAREERTSGASAGSTCTYLHLTPAGAAIAHSSARAFDYRLPQIRLTLERVARMCQF